MRKRLYLILYIAALLLAGCSDGSRDAVPRRAPRPSDTLYTWAKAMGVYDYQPERALRILDSAVVVGNVSALEADMYRMRIYGWTVMGAQVDSLLHGSAGVRFDSARAIGERLLAHDSVQAHLAQRQNVLEQMVYVVRQQQDTARWLQYARELVAVCHAQGAETEALRTEAEVGAVLCYKGKREQGLARLDSVIAQLDGAFCPSHGDTCSQRGRHFNELDAAIIALKRKINVLSREERCVETLPLAHRIMERLADYEQHPDIYHDGTYREPADSVQRADYIQFYRTQAQSIVTAAYAALGEHGNMNEAYSEIERSVREATAREHIARYHALEQQMLRADAESRSRQMMLVAVCSALGLVLILLFATYIYFQNRRIRQKNRALVRMIEKAPHAATEGAPTPPSHETEADTETRAALFQSIDASIRAERLYAAANIQRQDICRRFNIRREVLNQLLADHTSAASFPAYINGIRLAEACRMLREQPDVTVNAIADAVGLAPRNLRRLFVDQYGMTPTEYRQGLLEA